MKSVGQIDDQRTRITDSEVNENIRQSCTLNSQLGASLHDESQRSLRRKTRKRLATWHPNEMSHPFGYADDVDLYIA